VEAAALSILLSGLPATVSVAALVRGRLVAPLLRGSVERGCVLFAALAAGALLPLEAVLAESMLPGSAELVAACAPLAVGAVPWAAGEILSGPSRFGADALAGSLAAAQAFGWAAFLVSGGSSIATAAVAALAAAGAYLEVRGPVRSDSMIYES
jgi:hypothetical protein